MPPGLGTHLELQPAALEARPELALRLEAGVFRLLHTGISQRPGRREVVDFATLALVERRRRRWGNCAAAFNRSCVGLPACSEDEVSLL